MVNDLTKYNAFSTFDLKSVYHQLSVKESDRKYTVGPRMRTQRVQNSKDVGTTSAAFILYEYRIQYTISKNIS